MCTGVGFDGAVPAGTVGGPCLDPFLGGLDSVTRRTQQPQVGDGVIVTVLHMVDVASDSFASKLKFFIEVLAASEVLILRSSSDDLLASLLSVA